MGDTTEKSLTELLDEAFHITGPEALKAFMHTLLARIEKEKAERDAQLNRIEEMLAKLQPLLS
jgi:hypothetical protein